MTYSIEVIVISNRSRHILLVIVNRYSVSDIAHIHRFSMRWSPFSSSASKATSNTTDDASSDATSHLPSSASPSSVPPLDRPTMSREEQASAELAEFLKEIQIETSTANSQNSQSSNSGAAKFTRISGSSTTPEDITPDSLYPTEMSCRSALDYAMFCQSFGGQWVNIYRYGTFRSCSNHWSDFWLCMRTRQWDEKDRRKAINDHYKAKSIKYKTGPSSEDIWEVRTEPVRDAFQESLEELENQIAEWKRQNPGVPDPWGRDTGTLVK